MEEYKYTIKSNTIQAVGHEQELAVFDISEWAPEIVKYYKSLLAHKKDMEYAREYLNQMFFQSNSTLIDGALINSSIQLLAKCFSNQSGQGRRRLSPKKVFRSFSKQVGEEDFTRQFGQFRTARNTVLSHDDGCYSENIVALVVNQSSGVAEDIAEMTVRKRYLYRDNQKLLLRMITVVLAYLDDQLATVKKKLIEDYNQLSEKPPLRAVVCKNTPMATEW